MRPCPRALSLLAIALSGVAVIAQAPPAISASALASKLNGFVPMAMSQLGAVPGLSIAVVRDNETIYKNGFGVADVAAGTRVTADTVFYTASLAKAVTGMTAATLIADGRLSVDTPLSSLFPGLVPPAGTDLSKATLGGLLGHDPGFNSPTVNYVTTFVRPYERAELIQAYNTYSQPLPRFTYTNSNYMLAGEVIRDATGKPWQDAIAERVFLPLGMRRSTFYVSKAGTTARPYRLDPDGFTLVSLPKTDRLMTGAGGFFSTAVDVAELVKAFLNDGRVNGRQALAAKAVQLAQQQRSAVSADFTYFKRTGYGIGLYLGTYDGEPMNHHFGSITGYRSHMSFMPARHIGVAVLQNEGDAGSRFADLVAAYAYDLLLGKDADGLAAARIAEYKTTLERAKAQSPAWIAQLKAFSASPAPMPLPLAAYAGTYRSDRLGELSVSVEAGVLRVTFGEARGRAVQIGGNNVLVDYGGGAAPDPWTFTVVAGKVEGLDWDGRAFTKVAR